MLPALIAGGASILGGFLGGNATKDAAKTQAAAQLEAARIAADAAKFRPVGVTTAFGSSNFGKDEQGNVTSAGYTLTPEMQAQLGQLQGATGSALDQYLGAKEVNQPLLNNASTLFGLGGNYLSTTPQEQAQKYMADQQALLAPSRERQLGQLQNTLFNTGRSGLRVGATTAGGMSAASPEMEAYYNAMMQQDNQLAAQATQGGMDYANFGAGMLGQGSSALQSYYGNQQAAAVPYQTNLGLMQGIDAMGQQSLNMGAELGGRVTSANTAGAQMYQNGANSAASSMFDANRYSPLGAALGGIGNQMNQYQQNQANQANIDRYIGAMSNPVSNGQNASVMQGSSGMFGLPRQAAWDMNGSR